MSNPINTSNSAVTADAVEQNSGLRAADGKEPVPLLGVRVSGRLLGLIAEWVVTQRYRNIEKKPIEAVYAFPLPEAAAVCGLQVKIGDNVFTGDVEEREAAFERYDKAMSEGKGAYLLDAERPNYFQISVGNLLPEQEAEIEIRFLVLAKNVDRCIRLALPTTISPRYTPKDLPADVRAEIERITPPYADAVPYGLSLSLDAEFASAIKVIESPSHPIRSETTGNHANISFSQGEVALDRDVVLLFEVSEPNSAGAMVGSWKGRDHVLVELIPALDEKALMTPRAVTFLLDCSGSMKGDSIEQARRSVELCLRSLSEGDIFQIIRFGSNFVPMFAAPRSYTQANLDEAVKMVRSIQADLGGTEILPALESLFQEKPPVPDKTFLEKLIPSVFRPSNRKDEHSASDIKFHDLVVLTDGQVNNETKVLDWAKSNRHQCRIFCFGIGAGVSDFLVKGLARESRGEAEFIFPGERIEPKVLRQFSRLRTPVLRDVSIDWGGLSVEAAPVDIPPVFAGEPLQITARLPQGQPLTESAVIRLTGIDGEQRHSWEAKIRHLGESEAIARWWARLAIRDLESGFGVARTGSNQTRPGTSDAKKRNLIAISKEYQIISSETSFVIVEERTPENLTQEQAVLRRIPVAITVGWHGRTQIKAGIGAQAGAAFAGDVPIFLRKRAQTVFKSVSSAVTGESQKTVFKSCISVQQAATPEGKSDQSSESNIPWYLTLLQEARANGSFMLSKMLASNTGFSIDELRKWATTLIIDSSHESDRETILATALAMSLLTNRAAEEKPLWNAVYTKALRWLKSTNASGPGKIDLIEWVEGKLSPRA
ncbi:MAG: VWA domain-containing protein [Candidatus Riflebacteria bacterium]|nr:VWA domain-containing protein [Candidatus Riflebacteria bacterium]